MSIRKRIAMAWDILTGRMGYCVFRCEGGKPAKLVHSTMDQSELYATGKEAIRLMMKSDAATRIVVAIGSAEAAADTLMKIAPLMKAPVTVDRKDIN